MIKKAEGRATARTICFNDIINDIKTIEDKLNIKKKDMIGIKAYVDSNAQNFPNAYKYRPESTHYTMTRKKSGWDLECVLRDYTRNEKHTYNIILTEEAKKAILESMSDF